MKYCVLNKDYKGLITDKNVYSKLIQSDLNTEHYMFSNDIESSIFMANYMSNEVNGKRKSYLNKFANKNTIMYVTYKYVPRVGGYVFSFLTRENGKYRFDTYTTALTSHIVQAFQEAYVRVTKDLALKDKVYLLTNQAPLIKYMETHLKSNEPLKKMQITETREFLNLYRVHPIIFTYVSPQNSNDTRLLLVLSMKNELLLQLRLTEDYKLRNKLKIIDSVLMEFNKIPVLIDNKNLAIANVYPQFFFELKEPLEIEKAEFTVNNTKLGTLLSASKTLVNNMDTENGQAVAEEIEKESNLSNDLVNDTTVDSAEESNIEENKEDQEGAIEDMFSNFNKMLGGNQ
ncbi:hypothetical protein [Clostridium tertium]|uniref:hypothetical protein n=1 Tax=Clostridium tertium TaxID=1559 RepID=UPI0023B30659|nr:hypothetical protein [Clostridium tertium]